MPAKAVLREVVHRKPVPFFLYPERKDRDNFLAVYCVETLECGHQQQIFPSIDPLIARCRRCQKCDDLSAVTKKPSTSVSSERIKQAA